MTPEKRRQAREFINAIKEQIADYRQERAHEACQDHCPHPRRKPAAAQPCPASSQGKRRQRLLRQYQRYLAHVYAAERAERAGDLKEAAAELLLAEVAILQGAVTLLSLHVRIDFHYRLLLPHLPDLVREVLTDAGLLKKKP